MLFVALTMISVVNAIDPTLFYKADSMIDLKLPCYNEDSTTQIECSSAAKCNITMNYPNGSNYVKNNGMTNNLQYFNYTLPDTSTIGEYYVYVNCADNATNTYGYSVFSIMINNSGKSETPYLLSIVFILIPLILAIIALAWGLSLDGENKLYMNEGGQYQLEINYGWYGKIVLVFLSFLFFWIATFMTWQTSYIFTLTDNMTDILRWMFVIETILLGIMIPTFIILSVAKHVSNVKWLKEVERGFSGL